MYGQKMSRTVQPAVTVFGDNDICLIAVKEISPGVKKQMPHGHGESTVCSCVVFRKKQYWEEGKRGQFENMAMAMLRGRKNETLTGNLPPFQDCWAAAAW